MSLCTAAILPLRMATSLMPSMPEAGQITRPPRRSWSKVALIDMNDLSSILAGGACAISQNAKYTSYLQKQTSCHDQAMARPIESSYSR
jgi:hypothetical protein